MGYTSIPGVCGQSEFLFCGVHNEFSKAVNYLIAKRLFFYDARRAQQTGRCGKRFRSGQSLRLAGARSGQAAVEYFTVFAVVMALTLLTSYTFWPSVRDYLFGRDGFSAEVRRRVQFADGHAPIPEEAGDM